MSSSSDDSDYNVEEYIKPDIIRHTYNNEDLISDHEQESDSSHDSSDKETDVKTDEEENANSIQEHEVNSSKITSDKRKEVASTRTNSRFILYVTNLSGETTRSMLEDFFGDAGQIKSIRIPKVRLGNFAFVEMTDIEGFKNININMELDFSSFLSVKLKEKKIDVSVYHGYLLGIMEDNLDEAEKYEMVTDILNDLLAGTNTDDIVNAIFDKWHETHSTHLNEAERKQEEVDIAELLKTQTSISLQAAGQHNRQLTEEEKRIKQQILANYSQCSDKEEEDEEYAKSSDEDDPNLEKNTNKADVQKLAREKREQAKMESQQKKLKDKEDRAKQKASREDKKAKRQTAAAKGERKR
ncbi:CLUMA_CG004960, isoform A [Clunio marinus]|uniref:Coiled-coil domain-containing protein 43 n=1 Tax=Clunio marinus TaxID=568069 RepID=A0A1J1HUR3_9DIPT|nr:CLUMA_CG004960, isoform A [Clunio marinus]